MKTLIEILTFRRMIAPAILQLLFWAGIGGVLYGTWVLFVRGLWVWPLPLIFGTLLVRLLFELALLRFRSYERLSEISELLRSG